ncbi:MAG: substrate-binding domain-containing protein [Bacteroidales bacterium]|jgi:phosphate transport system substrate-binding protein|nr:substrate-binding domain-containing protein [Bacteroidales bacterium]
MKKIYLLGGLLCLALFACNKDDAVVDLSGLTIDNYPIVDGSTSTQPLSMIIACKLLGINYEWMPQEGTGGLFGERWVFPSSDKYLLAERIKVSQTHGAFMNLIDKNADLIFAHRTLSPDEKAYADELGVTLLETSIALDAFVFVVNMDNPVKSLTVKQVQDIYTGSITNWKEVGGKDKLIKPFVRPRNSGSQEVMEVLVMKDLEISDLFMESPIVSMGGVFPEVRAYDSGGICYTFDYYKRIMAQVSDENVPKIKINNIFPDENTVKDRTYPFVSEVHIVIRSDLDRNTMAYKLYEYLQTKEGKNIIVESGYIPN